MQYSTQMPPHPLPTEKVSKEQPPKPSVEVQANGQPAADAPRYWFAANGDACVAMRILGGGYVLIRTHDTPDGPEAVVSTFTDAEVANFEDTFEG